MFALQQCHARGYARARFLVILALATLVAVVHGADGPPAAICDPQAVIAHVQEQLRIYGPRSDRREHFAFIYRLGGEYFSSVVRGNECRGPDKCTIDTTAAAARIPPHSKVLGEWHTHAHSTGSRQLSEEDVRGAHHNVHIACYQAFYAVPNGQIYAWDPAKTSVPTAMASRKAWGDYVSGAQDGAAYLAATKESAEPR